MTIGLITIPYNVNFVVTHEGTGYQVRPEIKQTSVRCDGLKSRIISSDIGVMSEKYLNNRARKSRSLLQSRAVNMLYGAAQHGTDIQKAR